MSKTNRRHLLASGTAASRPPTRSPRGGATAAWPSSRPTALRARSISARSFASRSERQQEYVPAPGEIDRGAGDLPVRARETRPLPATTVGIGRELPVLTAPRRAARDGRAGANGRTQRDSIPELRCASVTNGATGAAIARRTALGFPSSATEPRAMARDDIKGGQAAPSISDRARRSEVRERPRAADWIGPCRGVAWGRLDPSLIRPASASGAGTADVGESRQS